MIKKDFPDFLGIGMQKAGTTWLFENLKDHPEIGLPPIKEVHFWNMNYDKGLDWYKSLFAALPQKIKGEITPAYAILPPQKIKKIKKLNPQMKLIYIIRNPVERAFSAALMDMERAGLTFADTPDQWFIDHFNSKDSLHRGDYARCIKGWLEFFPEEQMLVLNYEEIESNPLNFLEKCCNHIGAESSFFREQAKKPGNKINQRIFAGQNQQIRANLQEHLEQIYGKKWSAPKPIVKKLIS